MVAQMLGTEVQVRLVCSQRRTVHREGRRLLQLVESTDSQTSAGIPTESSPSSTSSAPVSATTNRERSGTVFRIGMNHRGSNFYTALILSIKVRNRYFSASLSSLINNHYLWNQLVTYLLIVTSTLNCVTPLQRVNRVKSFRWCSTEWVVFLTGFAYITFPRGILLSCYENYFLLNIHVVLINRGYVISGVDRCECGFQCRCGSGVIECWECSSGIQSVTLLSMSETCLCITRDYVQLQLLWRSCWIFQPTSAHIRISLIDSIRNIDIIIINHQILETFCFSCWSYLTAEDSTSS